MYLFKLNLLDNGYMLELNVDLVQIFSQEFKFCIATQQNKKKSLECISNLRIYFWKIIMLHCMEF